MAVWQRYDPQEWVVRPAPVNVVQDGDKRGEFLSKVELWAMEESGRRCGREEFAPEGPDFFQEIGEKIDCQNALHVLVFNFSF